VYRRREWNQRNAALLNWDNWQIETGDAFGSYFKSYFTDPKDETKPAKSDMEIAIRLEDTQLATVGSRFPS
jgi:hypothetical protein